MNLYLKWTSKGRIPSYQGGPPILYRKWTPRVVDPVLCLRGWHACRWDDAVYHISDELWVVELDGPIIEGDNKVVGTRLRTVRKAPIDDRRLRLFAADCAEAVLPIFEKQFPDDERPRLAVQAARDYANGEIGAAARYAARAAAGDAAGDAAWYAAGAAAGAAAGYAAWYAARAAAGDASGAAAGAAARAAAGAAAGDAARGAARAAARGAARDAQTKNLLVNYAGLDSDLFAHRDEVTT